MRQKGRHKRNRINTQKTSLVITVYKLVDKVQTTLLNHCTNVWQLTIMSDNSNIISVIYFEDFTNSPLNTII